MRALFTTQPGSGHWRPLAPFARALQTAGHTVAFATTPHFCGLIRPHGFACLPVPVGGVEIAPAAAASGAVAVRRCVGARVRGNPPRREPA